MSNPGLPTTARGVGLLAFGLLAAIYLVSPVASYGDGRNAGPTAASLVSQRNLNIDEFADVAWFGKYQTKFVRGHAYDYFPWTRSIFAVPVAAAVAVGHSVGIGNGPGAVVRSDTWEPLFLLVPGALTTAAAAALAGAVAWCHSAAGRRRSMVALFVALGTGLATGYWSTASRGMWQHGPACLWFTLALLAAWHVGNGRRQVAAAAVVGMAATAAAFTRPTFVFLGVALAVWLAVEHRQRLLAAGLGAVAVAIPIVVVNLASFGSLMMPYYDLGRAGAARTDPLWYGVVATIASPSRGMLVFMPAALAFAVAGGIFAIRSHSDTLLRLVLVVAAAVLLVFVATSPEGWWAGHSFGPRFAVDVIPVLAFLAVPAVDRLLTAPVSARVSIVACCLVVWSVFVHAQGATIRESDCWNSAPTDIDHDRARVWDWSNTQALTGVRWIAAGRSPLATDCVATSG